MRKFRCDYHYVDDLVFRYEEAGGYAINLSEGHLLQAIGFSMTTRDKRSATTSTSTLSIPGPPARLYRSTTVGTSSLRSTSASSRRTTSTPKPQREQSLCKFNQNNYRYEENRNRYEGIL